MSDEREIVKETKIKQFSAVEVGIEEEQLECNLEKYKSTGYKKKPIFLVSVTSKIF